MEEMLKQGGVIEGTPPGVRSDYISSTSILIYIEPSGSFQIKGHYDRIIGPEHRTIAYLMPTRNGAIFNMQALAKPIVKELLEKDVFGFVGVDLLVFPDPQMKTSSHHPLFWMIGLDCYLNDMGAVMYYFEFLIKSKADPQTGRFFVDSLPRNNPQPTPENIFLECTTFIKKIIYSLFIVLAINEEDSKNRILIEKFMIYCPYVIHPGLSELEYKDFFHKCRLEMILYDLEKKSGSSFILLDSLKNHFLSILGIG